MARRLRITDVDSCQTATVGDFKDEATRCPADIRSEGEVERLQCIAMLMIVRAAEIRGVRYHYGLVAIVPEGSMIRPPAVGEEFASSRYGDRQARKRQLIAFNSLNETTYQAL